MEFKGTKGKWNWHWLKMTPTIYVEGKDIASLKQLGIQEEHANALLISKAP